MSEHVTTAALDRWVRQFAALVAEKREYLTELDAAIGDADHGANMDRGLKAAVAALDETAPPNAGALFNKVGITLVSTVGGASGPLYGTLFMRMGASFGEIDAASPEQLASALRAGLEGIVARGKAEPGDKTMYDALSPSVDALDAAVAAQLPLVEALATALVAAEAGRDGHQDPGATSAALLIAALVKVTAEQAPV
jgi:dihydroxyacetone kinase-like protein